MVWHCVTSITVIKQLHLVRSVFETNRIAAIHRQPKSLARNLVITSCLGGTCIRILTFDKTGSFHKRKARSSRRRHNDPNIPVPQLPKRRSDDDSGKGLDAEDVPLHRLLAHKAKSNSISSWILHHFHEKQAYYEESEESRKSSCSPQAHFIPTPPNTIQNDNTTHVCAALGICEDEYLQL